jgi:hypothetical protein
MHPLHAIALVQPPVGSLVVPQQVLLLSLIVVWRRERRADELIDSRAYVHKVVNVASDPVTTALNLICG